MTSFNPDEFSAIEADQPPTQNSLIFLHPEDIVVSPDRQRKTFDEKKILELAESIERIGILHPLVVEALPDGEFRLVAGERRLRACRALLGRSEPVLIRSGQQSVKGLIPAIEHSTLTDDQRYEMELAENLERENLTWQETTEAVAKYHNFKLEKATAKGSVQTLEKTRVELQKAKSTVVDAVRLAPHLKDPEVAKAASAKEALKIVERKAAEQHRAQLAVRFDKSKTPHILIHGDALEELAKLPDSSFDVILTDPPYGVGAQSFGEQARTAHNYDDRPEVVLPLLEKLAQEAHRLAKPTGCIFMFCALRHWEKLHLDFTLAGWTVRDLPLIWYKLNNGMLPVPDKEPRQTYECILFAYREQFRVAKQGLSDVLTYAPPTKLLHAAQKPAALLADLLGRVALPGAKILDPFAGSGSIFLACNGLRLVATAVEGVEANYHTALSRINDALQAEQVDNAPDLKL